ESTAVRELKPFGIALMHEGLSAKDRDIIEALFLAGAVSVCEATQAYAWASALRAEVVVAMGKQSYDGSSEGFVDMPIVYLLQLLGRASVPGADAAIAVVLCNAARKGFYKKFALEPLPVESLLEASLSDHLNAEVASGVIEKKQD